MTVSIQSERRAHANVCALMLALMLGGPSLDAQSPEADSIAATRPGAWEVWGGIGGRSPQWGILEETPHMRLGALCSASACRRRKRRDSTSQRAPKWDCASVHRASQE